MIEERDALQDDAAAMDTAFNELHARFVRLREVLKNMQQNEMAMKDAMKAYILRLREEQERYNELKLSSQDLVRR